MAKFSMEDIAERYKDARTQYNQNGKQKMSDVENATGVQSSLISGLESGNRRPNIFDSATLAKHYGVSMDWLCGLRPGNDYRITPCAADDLCLSTEAIDNIINAKDHKRAEDISLGLNLLLGNSAFIRIAGELGALVKRSTIEKRRIAERLKNEYEPQGEDSGLPPDAYSEILDRDLEEDLLVELLRNHPELEGFVTLVIGRASADVQIKAIESLFDYLIRDVSGYYDLIP